MAQQIVTRDYAVTAITEQGTREFWVNGETEDEATDYVEETFTNEELGRFAEVTSIRVRETNSGGRTNAALFQTS